MPSFLAHLFAMAIHPILNDHRHCSGRSTLEKGVGGADVTRLALEEGMARFRAVKGAAESSTR